MHRRSFLALGAAGVAVTVLPAVAPSPRIVVAFDFGAEDVSMIGAYQDGRLVQVVKISRTLKFVLPGSPTHYEGFSYGSEEG